MRNGLRFFRRISVKQYKQDYADSNGRVGYVKHRPAGKIIPEYRDIKKDYIDEIYYATVKERCCAVEYAVENPVDEVAERSAEDKRERKPDTQRFLTDRNEIPENADTGNEREHCKECSSPEIDAESHAGIFYIGKPDKVTEYRYSLAVIHPIPHNTEKRDTESFYEDLGHLIQSDNAKCQI